MCVYITCCGRAVCLDLLNEHYYYYYCIQLRPSRLLVVLLAGGSAFEVGGEFEDCLVPDADQLGIVVARAVGVGDLWRLRTQYFRNAIHAHCTAHTLNIH